MNLLALAFLLFAAAMMPRAGHKADKEGTPVHPRPYAHTAPQMRVSCRDNQWREYAAK